MAQEQAGAYGAGRPSTNRTEDHALASISYSRGRHAVVMGKLAALARFTSSQTLSSLAIGFEAMLGCLRSNNG
jgi:hypothetical protein